MKKLTLALLTACALVLLLAPLALAQDLPAISADNPNPQKLLGYCMLAYILVSGLLRALSADNTSLPFAPSPAVLHWINAVCAVLETACLAIFGGTPWVQAVGAGALNFVLGLSHVGAAAGALKIKDAIARNTAANSAVPPAK